MASPTTHRSSHDGQESKRTYSPNNPTRRLSFQQTVCEQFPRIVQFFPLFETKKSTEKKKIEYSICLNSANEFSSERNVLFSYHREK